jgi:hypothetical protein
MTEQWAEGQANHIKRQRPALARRVGIAVGDHAREPGAWYVRVEWPSGAIDRLHSEDDVARFLERVR